MAKKLEIEARVILNLRRSGDSWSIETPPADPTEVTLLQDDLTVYDDTQVTEGADEDRVMELVGDAVKYVNRLLLPPDPEDDPGPEEKDLRFELNCPLFTRVIASGVTYMLEVARTGEDRSLLCRYSCEATPRQHESRQDPEEPLLLIEMFKGRLFLTQVEAGDKPGWMTGSRRLLKDVDARDVVDLLIPELIGDLNEETLRDLAGELAVLFHEVRQQKAAEPKAAEQEARKKPAKKPAKKPKKKVEDLPDEDDDEDDD